MASPSLKILNSLICDDVRIENTGKEIIVGVYTAGVSLSLLPGVATVCVWLLGIWQGEGATTILIRALDPQKSQVGSTSGVVRAILQGFRSSITMRGLILNVGVSGIYELQWRLLGEHWQTLDHILIQKG